MILVFCSKSSTIIPPRWELWNCTGSVLGLMCCQKLQWKCKGCFVAALGFSGGASVSLQCLTLHSSSLHTTSVQESWLILVSSWSVSYTSLWNIYSFCQQTTCLFFFPPLSEKCAPVRTSESPTAGGDLTGLGCPVRWVSAYPVESSPALQRGCSPLLGLLQQPETAHWIFTPTWRSTTQNFLFLWKSWK